MKDCFPTASFRAMSWKWVTDCWNAKSMSSLEQESLLFHTALLWLPGGSTSMAVISVGNQGCSLESSASAPAAVTFWKEVELCFPSDCRKKKKSLQVLCEQDEIFFYLFSPAFGRRVSLRLKRSHSPWPRRALDPARVWLWYWFHSGNSERLRLTQTDPTGLGKWDGGAAKACPTMGSLDRGPAAVGGKWTMDHLWETQCSRSTMGSCSGSCLSLAFIMITWLVQALFINPDKLLTSKTSCN